MSKFDMKYIPEKKHYQFLPSNPEEFVKKFDREIKYFFSLEKVKDNLDPLNVLTLSKIWREELNKSPRFIYHILDVLFYFLYITGIDVVINRSDFEIKLKPYLEYPEDWAIEI